MCHVIVTRRSCKLPISVQPLDPVMSEAIIPYFFEPLDYLSPRGVNLALGMFLGMS